MRNRIFLPTLEVDERIKTALKHKAEELQRPQSQLRRFALELYLFGSEMPDIPNNTNGNQPEAT